MAYYDYKIKQNFPCGCRIDEMPNGSLVIAYCPMHKAAPELYSDLKRGLVALESAFQIIDSENSFFVKHAQGLLVDIRKTLAKAKGK